MKKHRMICCAAAALSIGSLGALAPAASASGGVSPERFPVSFSTFNPCTNEDVDFTGTVLGVLDTTPGHQRFHAVEINMVGTGVTSGAAYREVFAITEVLQGSDETGPFAETLSTHTRVITPGPGNDFHADIVFHMTINANGELVVSFNHLNEGSCV